MPTIFTKGDLLTNATLNARAFGCTTAGAMDSGVSIAFKKQWPALAEALAKRATERKLTLGEVFAWSEGDTTLYALVVQESGAKMASLPAIERSLTTMVGLAAEAKLARVGVPRLGAGPAGLDWTRVKKIVSKVGVTTSIELVVFEQFIRAKE